VCNYLIQFLLTSVLSIEEREVHSDFPEAMSNTVLLFWHSLPEAVALLVSDINETTRMEVKSNKIGCQRIFQKSRNCFQILEPEGW
jgi:hypothetical protein